jgi:two-component system, OmpR family, sensor histidine kinase ArlS
MPVKLKITILFTIISALVLALVGGTVYYISSANRINSIKTRLTNRAITTARLLSQPEMFNQETISKIDAVTASALKNKTVQAYNEKNERIYSFSDSYSDTIPVRYNYLEDARANGSSYFSYGRQDAIAYFHTNHIVIISAAYDELGENNLHQLLIILVAACIGGIVISFISGYFFSTRLLSPVRNIADRVNEISAQNLAMRLPTGTSRDEWHYLTDTINGLLNRLQDSFESQRRFVSNASHELSTPLTAISSQLEVYLQKDRAAAEYKTVMRSVYEDVQHLSELTKTLLEFAKTSGDSGGIELNNFRIDEVLLRMPAELLKTNPAFSVDLSFTDLPEDDAGLLVFGNEELLFSAIKNVLINACKYSPGKHAMLKLSATDGDISIVIEDEGPGISEAEKKRIFEPFYRSETARKTDGFGLGLSLALRIVKLHKGEITVDSLDKGTSFVITLPSSTQLQF